MLDEHTHMHTLSCSDDMACGIGVSFLRRAHAYTVVVVEKAFSLSFFVLHYPP